MSWIGRASARRRPHRPPVPRRRRALNVKFRNLLTQKLALVAAKPRVSFDAEPACSLQKRFLS